MKTAHALAVVVLAAVATLGSSCSKHQTELILVVTTDGVRIPEDVRKLHLTVTDCEPSLDDVVYETDVELCSPELTSSCYNIPVTAVLFPGKTHGTDTVRVRVDAIGPGGTVISDAALFTFADEESLRLDFVLYANCLGNVACAARDQACGPLDTCIDLHPGPTNGALDLALPGSSDMSTPLPADMTMVDLAGVDLTTLPPDLTSTLDLAGCANVTCDMGEQCVAGVCQACGNYRDPCCFTGPGTGTSGGSCNQQNLTCNGQICLNCGNDGQLCCSNMVPSCLAPDVCTAGTCQMPPDMSMPGGIDMLVGPDDMKVTGSLDMFFKPLR